MENSLSDYGEVYFEEYEEDEYNEIILKYKESEAECDKILKKNLISCE